MKDSIEERIWAGLDAGVGVLWPLVMAGAVILLVWAVSGWVLR